MSSKRNKTASASDDSVKKKRKVISLEEKLKIISKHESGASKAKIGRDHSINESTVRHIIQNTKLYKDQGQSAASSSNAQTTRNRSIAMIEMERLLSIWLEDCNQKRIPLSQMTIKTKALSLFKAVQEKRNDEGETKETFCASSGWFDRFKKRTGIHSVRIVGESASADVSAANAYPAKLRQIIEEGHYVDEQIINVDETGLFWKRMPTKTYLAKKEKSQPGFKVAKDRLTLLFGGNASGDLKLKPMLIYRSENPHALKGYSKHSLPVYWKSNKKAWVTKSLFEDWFKNCFCPEAERYCKSINLDFKILLILDNAPGHPTALGDLCDNVKVIFLPPNTTSLIQPMDQGVIATFKAYYLRKTFAQAIEKTTGENVMTLTQFWKNFNIKNALENINEAWQEVTVSNMRAVWQKIIPHCSNDFGGFEAQVTEAVTEITQLGINLGMSELDNDNVRELLNSHDVDLNDEDLLNLDQQRAYDDDEQGTEETNEPETQTKEFTIKEFDAIFRHFETGKQMIMDADPNVERSIQVNRQVEKALSCYRVMHTEKKKSSSKQTSLLKYFHKL